MTLFAAPVFDALVIVAGHELFKGRGAAEGWAKKLEIELKTSVGVEKIGNGWVLSSRLDGADVVWGIYGQRLKRIEPPPVV
ncbi:MAG: hypothetical protein H7327_11670 [Herminiimonas sp.]|nr:hypothetical protein [Herminiimonas sp.]